MNDIVLFSVPNLSKVSGGPRTRINGISSALNSSHLTTLAIIGNPVQKLLKTIQSSKTEILYVESATNRIGFIDILSILLWRLKSKRIIVYIRDIYIELFPNEYKGFRKSITKVANLLTNYFYNSIADKLAFPTYEMGEEFFNHHPKYKKTQYFPLAPGTFLPKLTKRTRIEGHLNTEKIKLLYLGATGYKNSGFEHFLSFVKDTTYKYEFHVLTGDNIDTLLKTWKIDKETIYIKSLSHKEVFEYIYEKQITFAFHSRPINLYDSITFPIKLMDFISSLLPIISLRHSPIVSILGKNYPFFIDNFNSSDIERCIDQAIKVPTIYNETILHLEKVREDKLYENQIKLIEQNGK